MSDYDYGPLRTYELTWRSGHIETVQGHQVLFESYRSDVALGPFAAPAAEHPRLTIHGMFPGGHWRLMLSAPEADLLSIRDVTDVVGAEPLAEDGQ